MRQKGLQSAIPVEGFQRAIPVRPQRDKNELADDLLVFNNQNGLQLRSRPCSGVSIPACVSAQTDTPENGLPVSCRHVARETAASASIAGMSHSAHSRSFYSPYYQIRASRVSSDGP